MIGDNDRLASRLAQIVEPLHFDPVHESENLACDVGGQFLGQQKSDPNCCYAIGDAEKEEEALSRHDLEQCKGSQSRKDHEDRVHDVVGRDNARPPLWI